MATLCLRLTYRLHSNANATATATAIQYHRMGLADRLSNRTAAAKSTTLTCLRTFAVKVGRYIEAIDY